MASAKLVLFCLAIIGCVNAMKIMDKNEAAKMIIRDFKRFDDPVMHDLTADFGKLDMHDELSLPVAPVKEVVLNGKNAKSTTKKPTLPTTKKSGSHKSMIKEASALQDMTKVAKTTVKPALVNHKSHSALKIKKTNLSSGTTTTHSPIKKASVHHAKPDSKPRDVAKPTKQGFKVPNVIQASGEKPTISKKKPKSKMLKWKIKKHKKNKGKKYFFYKKNKYSRGYPSSYLRNYLWRTGFHHPYHHHRLHYFRRRHPYYNPFANPFYSYPYYSSLYSGKDYFFH